MFYYDAENKIAEWATFCESPLGGLVGAGRDGDAANSESKNMSLPRPWSYT